MSGNGPSKKGGNGRDARGRFVKGCSGGPGNPHANKVHKFRSMLIAHGDKDRNAEKLVKLIWDEALDGKQWAVKELLDRIIGKPRESIQVEGQFTLVDAVRTIRENRLAASRG